MILLSGVRTHGMRPQMFHAMYVHDIVWKKYGAKTGCVVTCGIEGKHMDDSAHYDGRGYDGRTYTIPDPVKLQEACDELDYALGDDFDVVLEDDHVHVEFQPHKPYSVGNK